MKMLFSFLKQNGIVAKDLSRLKMLFSEVEVSVFIWLQAALLLVCLLTGDVQLIIILFLSQPPPTLPNLCPCQSINGEMAPEYTGDQEEGEQISCMGHFQYFPKLTIYLVPKTPKTWNITLFMFRKSLISQLADLQLTLNRLQAG